MLGPNANSKPFIVLIPTNEDNEGKNSPFSNPEIRATHSIIPTIFSPPSANLDSHCQPYCVVKAVPVLPKPPFSSSLKFIPSFK